jgi:peptidylprolyl isomerase
MTRLAPVIAAALPLTLVLAACGPQEDDRAGGAAAESPAQEAPAQEAPAEAPAEEAPAEAPAAAGDPYVTADCATLAAVPAMEPPAGAVGIEGAATSFAADGIPSITLATAGTPATELGIVDVREGDGAEVQPGDTVTVNYCGAGQVGLSVFDSSWSRGEPISFPLEGLIPGWQEGIPGMKVGGQRMLVIPGALAYGEAPPPGIAPNETLVFVIELLDTASA